MGWPEPRLRFSYGGETRNVCPSLRQTAPCLHGSQSLRDVAPQEVVHCLEATWHLGHQLANHLLVLSRHSSLSLANTMMHDGAQQRSNGSSPSLAAPSAPQGMFPIHRPHGPRRVGLPAEAVAFSRRRLASRSAMRIGRSTPDLPEHGVRRRLLPHANDLDACRFAGRL